MSHARRWRRLVLHEWALPEDGDPEDLDLVASANPLSMITVESLRAKRAAPSWTLAHWRRFVCNLPTRSVTAAITEAEWLAAKRPGGDPRWRVDLSRPRLGVQV